MSIFIIAEIGINHNGSLAIAKRLIDVAKDCGADAVKFQKRTIDVVYSSAFLDSPRSSPWGVTQRAQKERLEFNEDDYQQIDAYCAEKGIEWFASAWDLQSHAFLQKFELKHHKVASAMIADEDLLRAIAADGKHTFISTGMSSLSCIDRAVEIFRTANCPFELMHCVSTYPVADEDANLRAIPALRARYGCDVGYSGHEVGLAVSCAAAALGISSLERHITLDRAMYGSDQAASIEPTRFRTLVRALRTIQDAMGDGRIGHPTAKEGPPARQLRGHIPCDAPELNGVTGGQTNET
ncbi:MAG TPA: N-acetylneuraminate synthase family protein [Candidatus Dormibacteraeota bacterium]|nr:N-acetylneuraminate synthase family protein [Candidatus Dormibacteraeota bacterium]